MLSVSPGVVRLLAVNAMGIDGRVQYYIGSSFRLDRKGSLGTLFSLK